MNYTPETMVILTRAGIVPKKIYTNISNHSPKTNCGCSYLHETHSKDAKKRNNE